MLEASNLGQIIGRARYGALERRPRPELAAAADQARMAECGRREVEAESARQQEAARRAQESELDRQHAERKKAERQAERAERQRRAAERAARPAPSGKKIAKRGSRQLQIRTLLAAHPAGLRAPEVAAMLGIETGLASAHLAALVKRDVEKGGDYGRYVYRLKNTKEN
jgi:hypothetical protein